MANKSFDSRKDFKPSVIRFRDHVQKEREDIARQLFKPVDEPPPSCQQPPKFRRLNAEKQMFKVTESSGGSCETEQNVNFFDAEDDVVTRVDTTVDPTVMQTPVTNATLAGFLARPVLIRTITWETGVNPGVSIAPWHSWATNTYVAEKLTRFHLLRGNLMLKITVNGSPFHYGKMMVHYQPLDQYSDLTQESATATFHTNPHIALLSSGSQRQHVIVDPGTNTGGCMCLPFFWPNNFMRVNVLQDFVDMGRLWFTAMADIKSTGSGTSDPEILVYAWMEDVQLTVPTRSAPASLFSNMLLYKQGEFEEEDGPVSGVAAVVAGIAGRLADVPVIGPFALATQIGASAVGGVAKIFGFSRPARLNEASSMRRSPGGGLAVTHGPDTVNKLTLDPKQEVTVDPRTVGLSAKDEMTIDYLCKEKESLLSQFSWTVDTRGQLWEANVSPFCAVKHGISANEFRITPTALSFASAPFRYWSGTLEFRFEVMASQMHRGRLGISYDPIQSNNNDPVGGGLDTPSNVNYLAVLDLNKTRNVTVKVGWCQDKPWRQVYLDPSIRNVQTPADAFVPMSDTYTNGFIGVNVLNALNSNEATSTVYVNVYVRAGDDFQLNCPQEDAIENISYFPYASSIFTHLLAWRQGEEDKDMVNDPEGAPVTVDLTGTKPTMVDMKYSIFSGDPIVTFRNILKRYNFSEVVYYWTTDVNAKQSESGWVWRYIESNFPKYYGYDPQAKTEVGVAIPFAPVKNTLMNYLTPAYAAWRGGLRVKYFPAGCGWKINNRVVYSLKLQRTAAPATVEAFATQEYVASMNNDGTQSCRKAAYLRNTSGYSGSTVEVTSQQHTLVAELPYYSDKRFAYAQNLDIMQGLNGDSSNTFRHTIYQNRRAGNSTGDDNIDSLDVGWEKWTAAGDDFSLFYYVNAPTQFHYTSKTPTITSPQTVS